MSKYAPSSRWVDQTAELERHFTPSVVQRIIKKTITSKGGRSSRTAYDEAPRIFSLPWDLDDDCTQIPETAASFVGRACKVGAQEYVSRWRAAVLNESKGRSELRDCLADLSKKCSDICMLLTSPSVTLAALEHAAIDLKIRLRRKGTWLEMPSATVDKYAQNGANFDVGATIANVQMLELLAKDAGRLFERKKPKGGDESLEWLFRFLKAIFEQVFERKFAASNQADAKEVGGPAVRFCAAVLAELGITMTGNAIRDRIVLADPQSPRSKRNR